MTIGRLSDIPSDGLGFDLAPYLETIKQGVDVYGQIRSQRNTPVPQQPAPAPVIIQQPAPRQSNALRYIVLGLAAVGGGLILYRAVRRSRS